MWTYVCSILHVLQSSVIELGSLDSVGRIVNI